MAIDFDRLMNLHMPEVTHHYGPRDTMFYALSVGLGADPLDRDQLAFVTEKDQRILPTFATILGHVGLWTHHPDAGIDASHVLHGAHSAILHRPLPIEATILARFRVADVVDKGAGKGAFVVTETEVSNKDSGEKLVTVRDIVVCRADGGFGGPPRPPLPPPHVVPDRAPDHVCDLPSLPQTALLYRLNGDDNPLHYDPDYAASAGFPGPVLHGLATYGIAGHAILGTLCDYDPTRLRALSCRFVAPAYPGETFRTELWLDEGLDGPVVSYRTRALERDVVVLSNGRAEIAL
ncbi:MaoC/PaaZ C-terminal domain-containing protein [soil metagenome]